MLKVASNSNNVIIDQRRPTRISSDFELKEDKLKSTTSNNSSSRLKISSISRVSLAKSRLKQPVACTSNESSQKQPSRLARPITQTGQLRQIQQPPQSQSQPQAQRNGAQVSNQPARVRPTSLALRAPAALSNRVAANSSLPLRASTKPLAFSNLNEIKSQQNNISTLIKQQPQATLKRKCTTSKQLVVSIATTNKTSANSSQDSRLSGLKNLVAIVHPQHSQCVNLNATPLMASSSSSATTATITTATSKVNKHSATTTKYESGKASDKDDNNNSSYSQEKKKESKQDDSQIIRQLKMPTTINVPSNGNNQINNGHHTEMTTSEMMPSSDATLPVTFTRTPLEDGNKIDHSVQSNYSNLLLSVASTAGDVDDKKQQTKANKNPSNKHSHGSYIQTSSFMLDDEQKQDNNTNCFNHDCLKSTLTKSPALSSSRKDNKDPQTAINDHMQPKPMGQQVLSLMMLDVGLLPSNTNYRQQRISPPKKSHVRLHQGSSSSSRQQYVDGNDVSSHFHDNCLQPTLAHDRDLEERLNLNAISYQNLPEQSNNYHSFQPSNHELLGLQVCTSSGDNENLRSISLPSSPSIRVRVNSNKSKACTVKTEHTQLSQTPQHIPLYSHENYRTTTTTKQYSPSSRRLHPSFDQLLSICDNQDSHSLSSSSCSSLNQCPPLLALSNQLSGFKFDELVKANRDMSGNEKQLDETELKQNQDFYQPLDQVAQVEKQHELLTNELASDLDENRSTKIDRAKLSAHPVSESSPYKGNHLKDQNSTIKYQTSHAGEAIGGESSTDYQLRRQQQARSHSISGQDFHLNGQYQRLKQSLYVQQNVLDSYQNYSAQGSNQTQQAPLPYQQQQHLPGRSPSPLSVSSQVNYGASNRDSSMKYSSDRQQRNQFHTSLECLNAGYSDYQQLQSQKLQLQQQQFQLQQHHQQSHQQQQRQQYQQHQMQHQQQQQIQLQQNQHYAASYVLVPSSINALTNHSGEQDIATVEIPPAQYQSNTVSSIATANSTSTYSNQTQNLINRAMAQVSHSPIRRLGLNGNGSSSSVLNHLSSLHHPMRAGHSSLSLASPSFIIEDKLHNEIRKLQSELKSEKEKNEALNSQLNINSSLMAAFEQSLTTLNTRLRQLTTLNEKKDNEIEELREQLRISKFNFTGEKSENSVCKQMSRATEETLGDRDTPSESIMMKTIENLKKQLIEKDRLLTDTRLEALSAAHQLEQLESKLNGDHSILVNEDELDEGVMVVNHSPSDSEAITDSAHFSEINSQITNSKQRYNDENFFCDNITVTKNNDKVTNEGHENDNVEDQRSNYSSDRQTEVKEKGSPSLSESVSQQFIDRDSEAMCRMMDNLLVTSTSG